MVYAFEKFRLDPDRRELLCGAHPVAVEPQVFDLLHCLVRHRARVVSKDDLIAELWNGRIISESTLNSRIAAARHAIGDRGEDQRLIRTINRKGFRFVGDVRLEKGPAIKGIDVPPPLAGQAEAGGMQIALAPPLPEKPSIAVLPFANLSGDPQQEYFTDGITEEIVTALSQFRWLFVIARSSSFTFKGRAVDARRIGHELGVRYLLEGSVRKAGNRVRIAAQLVDATTGAHLWASRFEGALEDIFDLQDQVAASVVGALAPKLEQAEIERAKRKPTENLDAYDLYLRGVADTVPYTREGYAEAFRLFRRAIELDAGFAAAYGMAAWCRVTQRANGWMAEPAAECAEGALMARRAVRLANEDAVAFCWGGFSLAYLAHELDDANVYVDRALALNPNFAPAWYLGGHLRVYSGDPEGGIERLNHAIRLSPLDPLIFRAYGGLAYAHFFAGRNDEAWVWAEKALRERPNWLTAVRIGAACHALAGRISEAESLIARMRELDSALRISNLRGLPPLRRAEDFARWADALRKAGLPD